MDTKTKIFWWTMGVLILASFGATFYRYLIKKDYIVQVQVDCDPYSEVCFVWNCDPESDEEGELCTGDPEEDVWYFKIINKNASQISSCDANDENCDALVCAQNEPDCEFVFCNPENMEENYASDCIDPAQYSLENPMEEENECEEGDEECLGSEDGEDESGVEEGGESEVLEDENLENTDVVDETENKEETDEDEVVEAENSDVSMDDAVSENEDNGMLLPVL